MTRHQQRRLVITTIATTMVLTIAFGLSRRDSTAFFEYLASHPTACSAARRGFRLLGKEDEFQAGMMRVVFKKLPTPQSPPFSSR
jgi:hypothetical protein